MAYSSVKRVACGYSALHYVIYEHGHNGHENRNAMLTAINMCRKVPYEIQMNRYWRRARSNHKIQIIAIVQSFSKKEFDPANEGDILKANQVGQQLVNEHFKGRQALVCTQIDGKKGYVHNHILINDVSMIDLKGCTKQQYYYKNIEIWTDEITQEYTILDLGEKNAEEKVTRTERAKREKGEYVYRDDIRERVMAAMKNSASEEDYFRRLSKNGIGVKKKISPKYGEHYVYELLDFSKVPEGTKLPKHGNRSARSYKLGTLYGPEALQVEIERFNRIMKKIEEEGTFTLDISIDMPTTTVKIEKETVQLTDVTAPEISYETVSAPVEIEAEEQEFEYVPEHKKSVSAKEKATEEITVPAPVSQVEVQRAGAQLEQQVVVPPPIVDDEEDDDDEIVKEVEKYPKREKSQENFFAKVQRKFKEKKESKQRNLSNRFRNLPLSDVSEDLDKEKDDRDLGG